MTVKQIQCLLCYLGYDPGAADGAWGEKTRAAANRFRTAAGLPEGDRLEEAACARLLQAVENSEFRAPVSDADWWKEIRYFRL